MFTFTPDEVQKRACWELARKAMIGGVSRVRGADRAQNLGVDQYVGQLCEMAISVFWYGDVLGPAHYAERRRRINETPNEGDGGTDIDGKAIDVKGSLMRASEDPLNYTLIVRPAELRPTTLYVLGLVEKFPAKVLLVGWEAGLNLKDRDPRFGDALTMEAGLLRPMGALRSAMFGVT